MYTLEEKYELIKEELKKSTSKNPVEISRNIMNKDFVNIHGSEHHFLDGGAFIVAFKNAGGETDIDASLDALAKRAQNMPGAMCGNWGVCGSVTSVGAALSILHDTGPLSNDGYYKDHMEFTSKVISRMSEIGGPRCCKRNAFISLSEGARYVKEKYDIDMEISPVKCEFSSHNIQCIGSNCPFNME
jgi:hypothetical protein